MHSAVAPMASSSHSLAFQKSFLGLRRIGPAATQGPGCGHLEGRSRQIRDRQSAEEQHGVATAHGSYEDLVADPLVDVVYIATPHPFHHANALLALRESMCWWRSRSP